MNGSRTMDHKVSYNENDKLTENWQRFMILWSATPEFFIGSCVICIVAILYTFFLTRKDADYQGQIGSMEGVGEPDKTADDFDQQQVSSVGNVRNRKATRNNLRKTKNYLGAYTEMVPQEEARTTEDHQGQFSPYRKSRYTMAAEKLASSLTDVQLEEEREIQREQLKAIFAIMKEKQEVFGIQDLSQVEEQMKYYG